MAELVINCPRCGAQSITGDVLAAKLTGQEYSWKLHFEAFCICRHCNRSTIFRISLRTGKSEHSDFFKATNPADVKFSLNSSFDIDGFVSLKDRFRGETPSYLPSDIEPVFAEAATCITVQCWNAAAAMFRLCIDLATKPMLPEEDLEGLNRKTRRDLGLRLPWLFDNKILPEDLRDLAKCNSHDRPWNKPQP